MFVYPAHRKADRALTKLERNRPAAEDRFYSENSGDEFRALLSPIVLPIKAMIRLGRFLTRLARGFTGVDGRSSCNQLDCGET